MKNVPASSEKIITEASAQKEVLEKDKVKVEAALVQVMEHLKEETSGLQQEKEVRYTSIILINLHALENVTVLIGL